MVPIDFNGIWGKFTPKIRHIGDVTKRDVNPSMCEYGFLINSCWPV